MKKPTVVRDNPLLAVNTHVRSNTIYGVWSPKDGRTAYAAAESSTIFKWDIEQGVTHYTIPEVVDFYDIFGFADRLEIIAVGTFGKIYSFDGTGWRKVSSPTTEWLEAIWGYDPNDWYIAGDEGTIWHFKNSEWKKIKFNDKNRLYSACGLEDGPVYITGSYGTIVKIMNDQAIRIPTGVSSHFLGIVRIPNTQKFLICGTGGLLFELENDKLTNIPTPYYAHLYGVDAVSTQEILSVGWEGYAAWFDGTKWTRQYLGENSYMEGVVYIGDGNYLAGGWYGRLMRYNRNTQIWNTIQTGRAERVNDVVIKNQQFVGVTDTGNVIYGNHAERDQPYCSQAPIDYNIIYNPSLEPASVIIGGKSGVFSLFDINSQTMTSLMNLTESLYCVSRFEGGAYFSGEDSILISYKNGQTVKLDILAKINNKRNIYSIAHLNDNLFYVKEYDVKKNKGDVSRIDVTNNVIKRPDQPEGGLSILFGDYGYVLGIKDNNIYYVENDTWVFKINCSSALLSKNEQISTAKVAGPDGVFHLGGSKGTILELNCNDKSNQITVYHSGAYEEINSLFIDDNRFVAGLNGGRVATGILSEYHRDFSYISAPAYHFTHALNDNEFCFAGESGVYGYLSPENRTITSKQSNFGDILCGKKFRDGILFAGCSFIAFIPGDITRIDEVKFFTIQNSIITSITTHGSKLYLGTSSGDVFTSDLSLYLNDTNITPNLQNLVNNLPSRVIDLTIVNSLILRIVMENGTIIEHALNRRPRITHQDVIKYQFPLQTLYKPITANQDETTTWLAGYENFLAQISGTEHQIHCLPEIVYTIALHGPIRKQEYWVGGSSGTLLILKNKQWYKIQTGVGNKLESGASNAQWFVIGTTYGGLRFENQDMLTMKTAAAFNENTLTQFFDKVFLPHKDRELTVTEELPETEYDATNMLKHKGFI